MWYRVTYKTKAGEVIHGDDVLLEQSSMQGAVYYAEHRVDGSYGEVDKVLHKVKRISRQEAIEMFNGNCIAWCSDPEDY